MKKKNSILCGFILTIIICFGSFIIGVKCHSFFTEWEVVDLAKIKQNNSLTIIGTTKTAYHEKNVVTNQYTAAQLALIIWQGMDCPHENKFKHEPLYVNLVEDSVWIIESRKPSMYFEISKNNGQLLGIKIGN